MIGLNFSFYELLFKNPFEHGCTHALIRTCPAKHASLSPIPDNILDLILNKKNNTVIITQAPYNINLSSNDETISTFSLNAASAELTRAKQLGASATIFQFGIAKQQKIDNALTRLTQNLTDLHFKHPPETWPTIVLKNSRPKGRAIGYSLLHFKHIATLPNIHFALDLANAYAANWALFTLTTFTNFFTRVLPKYINPSQLALIIANDIANNNKTELTHGIINPHLYKLIQTLNIPIIATCPPSRRAFSIATLNNAKNQYFITQRSQIWPHFPTVKNLERIKTDVLITTLSETPLTNLTANNIPAELLDQTSLSQIWQIKNYPNNTITIFNQQHEISSKPTIQDITLNGTTLTIHAEAEIYVQITTPNTTTLKQILPSTPNLFETQIDPSATQVIIFGHIPPFPATEHLFTIKSPTEPQFISTITIDTNTNITTVNITTDNGFDSLTFIVNNVPYPAAATLSNQTIWSAEIGNLSNQTTIKTIATWNTQTRTGPTLIINTISPPPISLFHRIQLERLTDNFKSSIKISIETLETISPTESPPVQLTIIVDDGISNENQKLPLESTKSILHTFQKIFPGAQYIQAKINNEIHESSMYSSQQSDNGIKVLFPSEQELTIWQNTTNLSDIYPVTEVQVEWNTPNIISNTLSNITETDTIEGFKKITASGFSANPIPPPLTPRTLRIKITFDYIYQELFLLNLYNI